MKRLLVTVIVTLFILSITYADENVKGVSENVESEKSIETDSSDKSESVKQKRGISHYGFGGFGYSAPAYGYPLHRYSPYSRFPGIYKSFTGAGPSFALTPGGASVHSYSVNYPRVVIQKPVLRPAIPPPVFVHQKPIVPAIYANRYPFIPRPVSVIPPTSFAAAPSPAFFPTHNHIHPVLAQGAFGAVRPQYPISSGFVPGSFSPAAFAPASFPSSAIPQPSFISQDGWRPVFTASQAPVLPQSPIVPPTSVLPPVSANRPSISVLPPLTGSTAANTPTLSNQLNNYYLPPDPAQQIQDIGVPQQQQQQQQLYTNEELAQADEQFHHQQHQQHELQEHLQHLHHQQQQQQQIQQIQQHQSFFRSQQNEGAVVPLSEQGYETASNNGRYSGPSSYDVQLNSRGRLH